MESFFAKRKIQFEARDIQKDHKYYREWHDRFQGDIVPLIVFDNGKFVIDGYDPESIKQVLKSTGLHPQNR